MDGLIEKNLSFAHAVAGDVLKKYPARVLRNDVDRAAEFGLLQAARTYDPSRGIAFTTYAYYRIKGAIYDDLRRSLRTAKFEEAANEYMKDHSESAPSRASVNEAYEEVRDIASSVVTSYLLSLQSMPQEPEQKNGESPLDCVLQNERRSAIQAALKRLPTKNREVLQKYYFEDLSYEEIGQQMSLSRSWVCRIHAKSIEMMRELLGKQSRTAGRVVPAATQPVPCPYSS